MTRDIAGVILAGGQARRMGGGDKALLPLGGSCLLSRVMGRLAPQVSRMALNANGDPDRFSEFALPVIADSAESVDGFAGPLAGVLAGMDWAAAQELDHVVTVAADTPFFPGDLVEMLVKAADGQGKPIALAATPLCGQMQRHPTFGLWPVALRDDLRAALAQGVRKIVQWGDGHGAACARFAVAGGIDPFFNVNTPDDLRMAETHLLAGTP